MTDRKTNRPTDQPTNQQTDTQGQRKVGTPFKKLLFQALVDKVDAELHGITTYPEKVAVEED